MKSLKTIIAERLKLTSKTKNETFEEKMKEMPIGKWEWPEHGISNKQYKKCKENVTEFARQEFGDDKYYMEKIYEQTYKYFLLAVGWSEEKIENSYIKGVKRLSETSWPQFEKYCVEIGWWHFVNWCIEQIKI